MGTLLLLHFNEVTDKNKNNSSSLCTRLEFFHKLFVGWLSCHSIRWTNKDQDKEAVEETLDESMRPVTSRQILESETPTTSGVWCGLCGRVRLFSFLFFIETGFLLMQRWPSMFHLQEVWLTRIYNGENLIYFSPKRSSALLSTWQTSMEMSSVKQEWYQWHQCKSIYWTSDSAWCVPVQGEINLQPLGWPQWICSLWDHYETTPSSGSMLIKRFKSFLFN